MNHSELVPVVRKDGVTIYGKVIDSKGKLGQYQVYSDISGGDSNTYNSFADAEKRMAALIGHAHSH